MGMRGSYTRPDPWTGMPQVDRWNALCARQLRMLRRRGLYPWLYVRYRELPFYVHERVWVVSWGTLILALLWLLSAQT